MQDRFELLEGLVIENRVYHLTSCPMSGGIDHAPRVLGLRSLEAGQIHMGFGEPVIKIDVLLTISVHTYKMCSLEM